MIHKLFKYFNDCLKQTRSYRTLESPDNGLDAMADINVCIYYISPNYLTCIYL